jgi:hypothetical protein
LVVASRDRRMKVLGFLEYQQERPELWEDVVEVVGWSRFRGVKTGIFYSVISFLF